RVSFTVDAFPDRQFRGQVQQVRLAATTTNNVVTYPVVVSVDNSDGTLLPGLTVNAEIEVSRRDDVLKVSNAALRYKPANQPATAAPGQGPRGAGMLEDLAAFVAGMDLAPGQKAAFETDLAAARQRQEEMRRAAEASRQATPQQRAGAGGPPMMRSGGGQGGGNAAGQMRQRQEEMRRAAEASRQATPQQRAGAGGPPMMRSGGGQGGGNAAGQMRQRMLERYQQDFAGFFATLDDNQRQAVERELANLAGARRATVYRLEAGKPVPVLVRVGATDGSSTEIAGNLKEGDLLVTGERAAAR